MSTNGPAGPPTSGSAPLSEDRYDKLSRLAKEQLAGAKNGVSSDPTFFPPLEADDTFPPLHQDFTDIMSGETEQDTEQKTLSLQPDTDRIGLPSQKRGPNFDGFIELRRLIKGGKLVIPHVDSETGKPTEVLRGEHPNDIPARFSVTDTSFQNTVWGEDGGRTPEVTIDGGDVSPGLDDFLSNLHITDTPSANETGTLITSKTGYDDTTRPTGLEPLFADTNPGNLESATPQKYPTNNEVPHYVQKSEPTHIINEAVPATVILSEIPTLVDQVIEKPQPKLIIGKPLRGTWFNRIIKSGKLAIQNTKEVFEDILNAQKNGKVKSVVLAHEFEPFVKDTLYEDKARISGVSEKVYGNWEGLRKETETEKKKRLGQEAYDVANRDQVNHLRNLTQKNKPLVTEKPTLRGTTFSRGFKKALKTITTSFTKNGALEHNENTKLTNEMTKRQELKEEDSLYFNNHYRKNDHELVDKNVIDTYLKEYDEEDKEEDYTLQVANKKEVEREKKAKEAKKNRSITTRLRTLFLSKEAERTELKQKINSRGMEGVDVIEQHPEANVDPEAYRLEVKKAAIDSALRRITEETRLKRESGERKLGPEGKGLLNMLDRGAQFFDNNVGPKTRFFTGVTLAATGALALYATPAIGTVAVITAAGAGVRVLGASAAYVGIKRTLDKYIKDIDDHNANRDKDDEKFNLKVGRTERKLIALAGAAGAALFGSLAGEYLAPTLGKVIGEYFPQINDTLFTRGVVPSVPVVPEVITGVTPQVIPLPEVSVTPVAPVSVPEVALPPVIETIVPTISPELLHHTVKPGENLWSIVRKTMEASNFEGFNVLHDNIKETMIAEALGKLPKNPQEYGITSGNINVIASGSNIDLTKAFTK